jgi:hypothetical protein
MGSLCQSELLRQRFGPGDIKEEPDFMDKPEVRKYLQVRSGTVSRSLLRATHASGVCSC